MCSWDLNSHATSIPLCGWIRDPLRGEWLQKAQRTVKEQLDLGNAVPPTSLWNTPVFLIPKKTGKWRLLQDLRPTNAIITPMGIQQPGIPNPAMISETRELSVTDSTRWFFHKCITLWCHTSFSLFITILEKQWTYANLSLDCVTTRNEKWSYNRSVCGTSALKLVRQHFSFILSYHYMDDILLAADDPVVLKNCSAFLWFSLDKFGLCTAADKVQSVPPW